MCQGPVFRKQYNRLRYGYTLVELSLVVLILAIMAAAVVPSLMPADSGKLDAAAQEIADAIRFARSEAMRLRQPHGFRVVFPERKVRVYRPNTGVVPWLPEYDVYHPVSKKPYTIYLDQELFASADSISGIREYRATCDQKPYVYFDVDGVPRCLNPHEVLLKTYDVTLTSGSNQRVVSLKPITGQVTIE